MKKRTSPHGLGVTVTPRAVFGVLLDGSHDGGRRVVRRFTRTRGPAGAADRSAAFMPEMAGAASQPLGDVTDGDATLTFGGGGGGDLFLASEFGDLAETDGLGASSARSAGEPFDGVLQELLTECRDALSLEPATAVVADRDVSYVVLEAPGADAASDKGRKQLLALLAEQLPDADAARVAFEPMTPSPDGVDRVLVIAPPADDAAVQSVRALRETSRGVPPVREIAAEVPLLIGLARRAAAELGAARAERAALPLPLSSGDGAAGAPVADELGDEYSYKGLEDALDVPSVDPAEPHPAELPAAGEAPDPVAAPLHPTTLVLRAGSEDTVVLVLEGETLHHYGLLSSLTAFEPPETICSRVLMLQDEHGLGDVGRILVLSDHQEQGLTDYLGTFFPEAQIHAVRELLPPDLTAGPDEAIEGGLVLAYAAARQLVTADPAYPSANLLPASLRRRRLTLPYSWHVYALILVIAATAFFFSGRYVMQENELAERRAEVALLAPETAEATAAELQAQIDSIQATTMGYVAALETLDSLLVGSDRWSRTLEGVSAAAKATPGFWVESWTHDPSMTALALTGTATGRDAVVSFADRIGGDIETLSFADVRDFPVYSFTLRVPVESRLPDAAAYLRAQADSLAAQPDRVSLTASPTAPVIPASL